MIQKPIEMSLIASYILFTCTLIILLISKDPQSSIALALSAAPLMLSMYLTFKDKKQSDSINAKIKSIEDRLTQLSLSRTR